MLFNGTSSLATTGGLGNIAADPSGVGGRTVVAIVKRSTSTGVHALAGLSSASATQFLMGFSGTELVADSPGGYRAGCEVGTGVAFVAIDHEGVDSGTAEVRMHAFRYGVDSEMQHADGSGGAGNFQPAPGGTHILLGAYRNGASSFADWFPGDVYMVGMANGRLADEDIETLAADPESWDDFLDWWVFEYVPQTGSLGSTVNDLSGGGAHLTTLTNITGSTSGYPFEGDTAPTVTSDPVLSGTPQVGQTLTATDGTADGTPTPEVTGRAWFMADAAEDFDGTEDEDYFELDEDTANLDLDSELVGKYLRYEVRWENTEGFAIGASNIVGPVEEAPPLQFTLYTSANGHGGEITSTEVQLAPSLAGLVGEISSEDAANGFDRYWVIYLQSGEAEKKMELLAWFSEQPEGDQEWSVGAALEGSGVTVDGEEDNATAPDGVSMVAPSSEGEAESLGIVDEEDFLGFYVGLSVAPGLQPDEDPYAVQIEFKLREVQE